MKKDPIDLAKRIDELFEAKSTPPEATMLIDMVMEGLDQGTIKVVEKIDGKWETNAWVKKAILLYFRMSPMKKMDEGHFFDKIPLKTFSGQHAHQRGLAG